ncbi:MAG TPA: hypothetical protein VMF58_13100 [Rhizomicrobium sp.]|nr:hypothetical protein [Rhizomicrobium sp.]
MPPNRVWLLRKFIDYVGMHGETHRLYAVNIDSRDAIPRQGGVLAITDEAGAPLYIADATSIYEFLIASDVWRRAQQQFGGKHVYFLSTGIEPWRASVTRSLREHLHPPMN